MDHTARQPRWPAVASLTVAGVTMFVGLSRFGIWDPWELTVAERARHGLDAIQATPPLSDWLISLSFELFGVSAFTGRLPFAVAGLMLCMLIYELVRRVEGPRAAWLSVIVVATCPLVVLNSRQMMGEAPAMLAQALVGAAAWFLATSRSPTTGVLWFGALVVATAVSTAASGALLGPLPAVVAVVIAAALVGGFRTPVARYPGAWLVLLVALPLAVLIARAVLADAADYSLWLGGLPRGDDPPTFDAALERAFFGFAPWSAVTVVAGAHALRFPTTLQATRNASDTRLMFRLTLVLWAILSYACLTLFTSRYGAATYLALAAVAPLTAIFFRDALGNKEARWPELVVSLLFVGLLVRDFALYPSSPLSALPAEDLAVPPVFNPRAVWAGLLGAFGLTLALALAGQPEKPTLGAPWRWMAAQFKAQWVFKLWIVLAAALMVAMLVFGILCFVMPLPLPTITVRVGKVLLFVPPAIIALVVGAPQLHYHYAKLGRWTLAPVLGAGIAFGCYLTLGYQLELSQHFSPRKAYDRYEELADTSAEPLAVYRTDDPAMSYYTQSEVRALKSERDVIDYLSSAERQWLIFSADELNGLNQAYRKQTGAHLFIADARSAKLLLAASQPLPDMENENILAKFVMTEEPKPEFPAGTVFDDKVELIGYDLKLPSKGYVGAGRRFRVVWYWRALQTLGKQKVFVHIDGQGNRINGDHDPVDGKYPTHDWRQGDIVVDEQRLTVPANYGVGDYQIYVGLFSGDTRLPISEGSNDGENRTLVGTLTVR